MRQLPTPAVPMTLAVPPSPAHRHEPTRQITRHDLIDSEPSDDQVLVVVFLRGGADGLTLVPPVQDDAYRRARPVLAVDASSAIDLDGYFALNADLRPLMTSIERGACVLVHGTGSNDSSRSHFQAQDTMEHGGYEVGSGWLGRFLRARDGRPSALSAVAIGTTRPESLRGAPAGAVMQTIRDFSLDGSEEETAIIDALARLYADAGGSIGAAGADTIAAVRRLRALRAESSPPAHGAVYPAGDFGRGLREIARLVKADVGLAATTIDLPGWDTHFVQSRVIGGLMRSLANGLDAFLTDLGSAAARVTVVVMTEFGRRLKENTSFGTDHGAGSVMMVLGAGAAAPGMSRSIVSGWPNLSAEHLDDVGDVPAAIDYRDVLSPVLAQHSPGVDLTQVWG